MKLATKKSAPLARPNGQKSANANGTAVSRPAKTAKLTVANGHVDEPNGIARLSPRQLEAVNLLFKGLTYKEISESLGLSLFTVRSHLHSAYKRLQVKSRGQAVARILRETSGDTRALYHGHELAPLSSRSASQMIFTKS